MKLYYCKKAKYALLVHCIAAVSPNQVFSWWNVPWTAFLIPYALKYDGPGLISISSMFSFNKKYVAISTHTHTHWAATLDTNEYLQLKNNSYSK